MSTNVVSPNRPRRLLSIDGGGLCGLIPAEALIEIEKQLDDLTGDPQPLCNRFDLIGGTSTGAILAAGIALGMKAADLRDFYLEFGPDIFDKVFWPKRFWHKYPSAPIEKHLKDKFGATTTLGDSRLRTMVLLVAKNATLGNQQSRESVLCRQQADSVVAHCAGEFRRADIFSTACICHS